jgi:FkbM family methyltransferase
MATQPRLRDRLDPYSQAKYVAWRALERAGHASSVVVTVTGGGPRLRLRSPPARDAAIAYELFVEELYRMPLEKVRGHVKCVVDLGANAGFAIAYMARLLPEARFIAFEPNPTLVKALYHNIRLNRLEPRVSVHAAAACVADGVVDLSDEEAESTLLIRPGVPTLRVPAEDVFTAVNADRVDLLKMDIEGAEYPILADPRFAELGPGAVVMEWHSTEDHPDGRRWCTERLESLGYSVDPYRELSARTGMLLALAK